MLRWSRRWRVRGRRSGPGTRRFRRWYWSSAPGSIGAAGGLRLRHFAAMRWADPDQAAREDGAYDEVAVRLPEVFVGGEGLARGPAAVLGTLLHEAAHALAHVRGVKDTSRQGRWHNARFKALAEELGIEVAKDPRIGWSPTTTPAATRDGYAEVIAELGRVLRLHRSVEITDSGRTKKPSQPPCVCECGRRIRVSPTVLAAGPITCGVCGADFTPDQPDEDNKRLIVTASPTEVTDTGSVGAVCVGGPFVADVRGGELAASVTAASGTGGRSTTNRRRRSWVGSDGDRGG